MAIEQHLLLEEACIGPGEEWAFPPEGWRFVLVQSGQGYLMREEPQALDTGCAAMLSPRGSGVVRASQLSTLVFSRFSFHPERLSDLLTPVERHYLESAETQRHLACRVFPAGDPVSLRFAEMLKGTLGEGSLALRLGMLQLIALAVGAENAVGILGHVTVSSARDRVLRRLARMTEGEFIACSVENLAEECRCSPRHLSRVFRTSFGISLSARQTELRMQRAARLLRESDIKISQVALDCGYRHIGLFNATFKRRWRSTPSQWRQRAASEDRPIQAAVG